MSFSSPLVLVTGSAGHLGKALMLSLDSYGYKPIGIDILESSTTTVVGSVYDAEFISSLFTKYKFEYVIHAATLHKPHVGTHSKLEFVKTNVEGTLVLLEESAKAEKNNVKTFVYVSTTSAFGSVLVTKEGEPTSWIHEGCVGKGMPKNVYGVTKEAAEGLCWLVISKGGMGVVVLRTARFFPEGDDSFEGELDDDNLKVLELAYRRVDIADVVGVCVCAMKRGGGGGQEGFWGRYVISAPTPFVRDEDEKDLGESDKVGDVLGRRVKGVKEAFEGKGWGFLKRLDRVYDSSLAERELGWKAEYTFERAVENVRNGKEWKSELSLEVGKLGYHSYNSGVYTKRD
ncbi:putative NAD dependent epimerase/dehydratase [Podospora fimiseda]|uniref:NAD dependent epimerase/dehydratase n=1 Tax=Podospora fimiseda TaxID=252190 RepID=A0AAN6YNY0_9PEZI|nr:putative NAD dependent epimerase/dehydratase [Podospora fimiseda]